MRPWRESQSIHEESGSGRQRILGVNCKTARWPILRLVLERVSIARQPGGDARSGGMASEFEDELIALDARLEMAQKAAEGLVGSLKRVRRAASVGQVGDMVKGLGALDDRLADANAAARDLSGAWRFDAS